MPLVRVLLLLALAACQAKAVQIHIHFAALERMLAQQVFTEDGRRYVRGSQTNRCNFAYLEKPQVRGVDGRLQIRARFTGRTSLDLFGKCIGLGDAFELAITASPHYKDGYIGLANVTAVPHNRGGFYARSVCAALAGSLPRQFRYPLAADAKRALEAPILGQEGYLRELRRFNVPALWVTDEALVLQVDFELAVK